MKKTVITIIALMISTILFGNNTSALTYQSSYDLDFTFNPSVTISLSSADLVINDLTPGTYSDSNIITVTTSTNSSGGYTLGASVGNSSYNTTNLIQSGVSDNFASIAENASQPQLTTPNTWGYATSSDGSSWTAYSGLPLYDSADVTNVKELVPATGQRGEDTISFKIAAYADSSTASGAYNNVINFVATAEVEPEPTGLDLYSTIASMSKGTQTAADLQATITTDNSGVYEYNSSVFGTSSDVSNDHKIYYYRGILDSNLDGTSSTYGSNGDGLLWPNYVRLNDTCWRIVRTTGSGGVKMIYNGLYSGGTTANSCANAQSNAQVTTKAFNGTSSTYRQIVRVGYTYNSTYATNTSQSGTIAQVFGSNSNPATNDTRSTIKEYIEDTWYASNMTGYTSKLEASAGYCNDRTMNTTTSWTAPLAESTTIASTYGTSGQQAYYFGAYPRNANAAQLPSLTCGNKYSQIDRSTVDLYRYVSGSTGVSNQLKYPAALLTADEASFAGSGNSASNGSAYHANSFLRSGSGFWLLSPYYRASNGSAIEFYLYSSGDLDSNYVYSTNGVRPAISLTSGTTAASGSGTATDPWVVNAP